MFFVLGTGLKVKAGESESARGWIWGGSEDRDLGVTGILSDGNESGMGWISVNSLGCDTDKNGFTDIACGGNNTTSLLINYGINIPSGNGDVSGYVWSDNLGWIDFGNNCIEDNFPGNDSDIESVTGHVGTCVPTDATKYCAKSCIPHGGGSGGVYRSGNSLVGWARIVGIAQETVSGNSGGWRGWIKMNGTTKNGASYGIKIDSSSSPEKILPCSGGVSCAWNGENSDDPAVSTNVANGLGWFDFSNVTIEKAKTLKICVESCTTGENVTEITKTIQLNDPISLRACYNTSSGCKDGGDATNSATWNDTGNPSNSVDVQAGKGNYKGTASGTEQVNVSYVDGSITVNTWTKINVGCTHDPSSCEDVTKKANTCKNSFFPDNCGSYSCPGSRDCTGWIETGPQ